MSFLGQQHTDDEVSKFVWFKYHTLAVKELRDSVISITCGLLRAILCHRGAVLISLKLTPLKDQLVGVGHVSLYASYTWPWIIFSFIYLMLMCKNTVSLTELFPNSCLRHSFSCEVSMDSVTGGRTKLLWHRSLVCEVLVSGVFTIMLFWNTMLLIQGILLY